MLKIVNAPYSSINTSKRYSLYLQNNYGLIVGCIYIFNMSTSTHNPKALVIEKPSKALVDFMNKLKDRKMSQLEKLRNKKDCTIQVNV